MSGLVQISLASSILIWIEKKDITYFFIIDSCVYYFFQFQCGLISEDEKYPFPPRFTRFLGISGPRTHQYYFSSLPREVMMGPRTGNDQKTGKTKAEMGIFHPQKSILTQIERKQYRYIVLCTKNMHSFFGLPDFGFFNQSTSLFPQL